MYQGFFASFQQEKRLLSLNYAEGRFALKFPFPCKTGYGRGKRAKTSVAR